MKIFAILFFLIFNSAHADLYDRVRLEDSLRTRVESVLKIYDNNINVLIRIDYKNFEGMLPGTNIISKDSFTPIKIESSDIAKVNVELYTTKKDLNNAANDLVYRVIPFEKSKIAVQVVIIDPQTAVEIAKTIDSQSLSEIMKDTTKSLSNWLLILTVTCLISAFGFGFYINQKRMSEFKTQMALIATALSDSSLGGSSPKWNEPIDSAPSSADSQSLIDSIGKLSITSLKELMADCYWCSQDQYAVWIWKKMSNEQRKSLLDQLSFMKDYSHFIVGLNSSEESFHDHPYYLDPVSVAEISQSDLASLVQANVSLWHTISPMRQNTLPLALESKLAAVQTKPTKSKIQNSMKSSLRELSMATSVGDLSFEDERALLEKPELVPLEFKKQVKSLVWLALQTDEKIQNTLSRYDARSLASAWVGPEEVLSKLEKHLPEKKLKVLQAYTKKMNPSRSSTTFHQLVSEGWREDAA